MQQAFLINWTLRLTFSSEFSLMLHGRIKQQTERLHCRLFICFLSFIVCVLFLQRNTEHAAEREAGHFVPVLRISHFLFNCCHSWRNTKRSSLDGHTEHQSGLTVQKQRILRIFIIFAATAGGVCLSQHIYKLEAREGQ